MEAQPFEILRDWIIEASKHSDIKEPTAMVLSTVNQNQPDSRVVLAKEISEKGITFYTNTLSQKGEQLSQNPQCSLLFYWDPLFRQVRIKGRVSLTSREKTEAYWKTRPRQSQISQWVSQQSQPLESQDFLENKVQEAEQKFKDKQVPCPQNWSGYVVSVEQIEIWEGRDYRLHDRFLWTQDEKGNWVSQKLYP